MISNWNSKYILANAYCKRAMSILLAQYMSLYQYLVNQCCCGRYDCIASRNWLLPQELTRFYCNINKKKLPVFILQEKAENFVMAALFGASEEGNLQGIKDLVKMAQNIDLLATNKV